MRDSLEDLRKHLFIVIERLQDDDDEMDLDRAKEIRATAETLIATGKLEVAALRAAHDVELAMEPTGFVGKRSPALGAGGGG